MVVAEERSSFFSLEEIQTAGSQFLAPIQTISASDDIQLAYRVYIPEQPKAVVLFYHGAGAHSGLTYNHIGVGLRDTHNIAVYMPDIRGHGFSEGKRGDAPSVKQVWGDINTLINQIRSGYPELPLFIGGHSGGAGLVLNYSSWKERLPVAGYIFVAPYFGYRSNTEYDQPKVEFSTVKVSNFVINAITGGALMGHSKAVYYHFPQEVLEKNPEIVTFNTVNMANALTPTSPHDQFSKLKKFGLWIGDSDESFDPVKIKEFAEQNHNSRADATIQVVTGENHFSILLKAYDLIGIWIEESLSQ